MMASQVLVSSTSVPGTVTPLNKRMNPIASTMPGTASEAVAIQSSHWRAGKRVRNIR